MISRMKNTIRTDFVVSYKIITEEFHTDIACSTLDEAINKMKEIADENEGKNINIVMSQRQVLIIGNY